MFALKSKDTFSTRQSLNYQSIYATLQWALRLIAFKA